MYNGIGLQTARGSGTNGYVQKNLSFVKQTKKPIEYKSEDDFKRLERELNRVPNKDILEHQNKRQIELKCLEMEDQMEQQGFTAQEIEAKVKEFRETLKHKMESSVLKKTEWLLENFPQNVKETHQMAEVNHQKNDLMKTVLKIGPNFIEGSSLDPTRKAREAAAKQEQQKKYLLVKEPSPEKEIKNNTKEDKHKNIKKSESHKRKSSKHSSDSDSDSDSVKSYSSDESHKKRKKSKSKDKRTKDSKRQKSKDRKSRKNKKYSDSSSSSDSDSDSNSSSDSQSESNDSSDDSHYKSRNGRRNERSKKEHPKRLPSPETDRNRSKSYAELRESTHDFDDNTKTGHSIAMNIRQMRKEAQNFVALDKQHNPLNDSQKPKEKIETKRDHKELSPKTRESPRRGYSRSSSRSSERDSRVKRLKSAVYETSAAKKIREVPKSYDEKRYDSKKERSLSPKNRSRHSSHSQRSRSPSVHSYDSKSSNRSSRSRSSSSSKSSTKSSKSSSRSESRSRSPSIPRRKGSPSFLDKRRITSARKRPIPYRRGSPNSSLRSSRSSRSQSGCSSRSLSVSSSDSFNSNTYKLI